MAINSRFNEAFNFENFKSNNPEHDEPIGKDLIEQLALECIRVEKLKPPLDITHIEKNNRIIEPVQYTSNFKHSINNIGLLWKIRKQIEDRRKNLLEKATNGLVKVEDLNSLFVEHDLEIHSMFCAALSVGQHNQEVNTHHFFDVGLKKVLAEKQKADDRFYEQYFTSMSIMGDILHDFYSYEENHPYKPKLVIDCVELLCLQNNLKFPKDRNSDNFIRLQKNYLNFIEPHKSWKGVSKNQYKQLDMKLFNKKYQPLFKKFSHV